MQTLIPDAAAVNVLVISTADTCRDVILTFVSGLESVEVGGLESVVGRNRIWLSAWARGFGSSCD